MNMHKTPQNNERFLVKSPKFLGGIMKFIKTIRNTAFSVAISKLFGTLLVIGFSLTSLNVAIAQSSGSEQLLNVICIEHKRKTIITYNSADDAWCAMGNQNDCSKKRGLATSRACAYSARKAKPFLETAVATTSSTTAVTNESNQPENVSSSSQETVATTTSNNSAPVASAREEQLQDELLALQERLVALRVKQLELRKREMELRKRLSDSDGGVSLN